MSADLTIRKVPRFIVVLLLVGEIFLGIGFWNRTAPVATKGYVIKNGPEYLLIWNDSDGTQGIFRSAELGAVFEYASGKLKLQRTANPNPNDEVESIWLRKEMGRNILFWKTSRFPHINRLTFSGSDEAEAFQAAFKKGAYTPSPYGHSILLTSTLSDLRLN